MNFLREPHAVWWTMGPSSNTPERVRELIEAGASGVRLTFSYKDVDEQRKLASMVKTAAREVGKPCLVVADIAGEKIRLTDLDGIKRVDVTEGERWTLVGPNAEFNMRAKRLPVTSEKILRAVVPGVRLTIGDGSASFVVVGRRSQASGEEVAVVAESAGVLNPNRGIVAETEAFAPDPLTEKDHADLEGIAKGGDFDAVAISFVAAPEEIEVARRVVSSRDLPIIAKIETASGVKRAAEIAEAADAVMVARGDLALYAPWEKVGHLSHQIVTAAKSRDRPWIMATQVAEGLERFTIPTRAEISDLTTWGNLGANAVMLSYETAFGPRPVDAVRAVGKVLSTCKGGGLP